MSGGEPRKEEDFIADSIHGLMGDPRWEAVELLVSNHRDELVRFMSDPSLAGDHGRLAHSAGAVDALGHLLQGFLEIKNRSKRV